jgi:prenyltransferase beta subunit
MKYLILSILFSLNAFSFAEEKDKVEKSIDKALVVLMKLQKKDGGIYEGSYGTAMTSLAIMAFASAGHMPDDETPEGKTVKRALEYVLKDELQDSNGYFGRSDRSRMYGHGIITLMLSEMIGMGLDAKQDLRIRKKLEHAIKLTLWSQKQKQRTEKSFGGWRYFPGSHDSDLSVTVWHLMSLRAANDAGIKVPKDAIDDAVEYLKKCYSSKRKNKRVTNTKSAFGYKVGSGPKYAMASAGLLAMQVSGQYEAPETLGAADWLLAQKLNYSEKYFFYGTYYYSQGMSQRGGKYLDHAKKEVEKVLFEAQEPDGSWVANGEERGHGRIYATALAVLSLSVSYHYLPIYQR